MVAHAKANPGKLNISTLGGFADLMSEMFKREAGVEDADRALSRRGRGDIGVMRGDAHMTLNGYVAVKARSRRARCACWRSPA